MEIPDTTSADDLVRGMLRDAADLILSTRVARGPYTGYRWEDHLYAHTPDLFEADLATMTLDDLDDICDAAAATAVRTFLPN